MQCTPVQPERDRSPVLLTLLALILIGILILL